MYPVWPSSTWNVYERVVETDSSNSTPTVAEMMPHGSPMLLENEVVRLLSTVVEIWTSAGPVTGLETECEGPVISYWSSLEKEEQSRLKSLGSTGIPWTLSPAPPQSPQQ
jgi:hypothetical protein